MRITRSDRSKIEQDICFALYAIRGKGLTPDPATIARFAGCKPRVVSRFLEEDVSLKALAYSIKAHTGALLPV